MSKHFNCTVIRLQRVLKRYFVIGEVQFFSPRSRFPHMSCKADEFFNHLCGFNRTVLIFPNGIR